MEMHQYLVTLLYSKEKQQSVIISKTPKDAVLAMIKQVDVFVRKGYLICKIKACKWNNIDMADVKVELINSTKKSVHYYRFDFDI